MKTFVSLTTVMGLLLFSAEPVAAQNGDPQCYSNCDYEYQQKISACDQEYDIRNIDHDYCEYDAWNFYDACKADCDNPGPSLTYLDRTSMPFRAVDIIGISKMAEA